VSGSLGMNIGRYGNTTSATLPLADVA